MKLHSLWFSCLFFLCTTSFAQDKITFRTGEEVSGLVIEITETQLKYKKAENPDGPLYTVSKADVGMVEYANGVRELFNYSEPKPTEVYVIDSRAISVPVAADDARQGRYDARRYYRSYRPAMMGTFGITAATSVIGGIFPAVKLSSTPPDLNHLGVSDARLIANSEYMTAYQKEAFRMKKKKVWVGYTLGALVNFGVVLFSAMVLTDGELLNFGP